MSFCPHVIVIVRFSYSNGEQDASRTVTSIRPINLWKCACRIYGIYRFCKPRSGIHNQSKRDSQSVGNMSRNSPVVCLDIIGSFIFYLRRGTPGRWGKCSLRTSSYAIYPHINCQLQTCVLEYLLRLSFVTFLWAMFVYKWTFLFLWPLAPFSQCRQRFWGT